MDRDLFDWLIEALEEPLDEDEQADRDRRDRWSWMDDVR